MSGFRYTAPERLQFREGGGCLSFFGIPFFLAGLFLLATASGAIPMSDDGDLGGWARPLLGLIGVMFTSVGGAVVFGRHWTTLDVTERAATTSWGLLVPLKARSRRLDEFRCVRIGFEAGDSDSADKFPVALKAHGGPDLVLSSPTAYQEARTSAVEAARHLGFALEDASGDHAVAVDPANADRPLQQRAAHEARAAVRPARPAAARSEVHHETTGARIVVPHRPLNQLGLLLVLAPVIVPVVVVPWMWNFFQATRTPEAVGLAFLAMFTLFFGVLPAVTIVNGILRARHGYTEMRVTRDGVTIQERGAWRTRTVASIDAADILDVDYGTRETGTGPARHAVEQKLMEAAAKWTKARGVIVKSRRGLTAFGQDLDDEEIRYLSRVVRQALVTRT